MAEPTYGQLSEFFAQAKAGRVTLENFQAYLRNPSKFVVADALSRDPGVYPVMVDYGKTLAEMIAVGHYDWVNFDITPEYFPISGGGVVGCTLELIHLDKEATTTTVLKHLEAHGMRPATLMELLALGAAHPDLQRQFILVAFGSVCVNRFGRRGVPVLLMNKTFRNLSIGWYGNGSGWHESCRIVAVRK